ncbi:MAG: hypothetical protein ACK46Y_12255 [Fluviicola sp.]
MKKIKPIYLGFLVVFLSACGGSVLDVNPAESKLKIKTQNIEKELFSSFGAFKFCYYDLANEDIDLANYWTVYCLQFGEIPDSTFEKKFIDFHKVPILKQTHSEIKKEFKDLSKTEEEIVNGFKRLSIHLPHAKFPSTIYFSYSGFQSSAFCTDKSVMIGLERYLGEKNKITQSLPPNLFYEWVKKGMNPIYLERDAVCSWAITHLVDLENPRNTIEALINYGKVIYLTEAAFPEMEKEKIIRYSKRDYDWAMRNESAFWQYIVDQKQLFILDDKIMANYLQESPFTAGIPMKGPDRLGQFLGWRIVQSYMEQYDITIKELIDLPYTELLQEYEVNE